MSGSNCCFLTWIQVSQGKGKVVWYSHLFKNFPVCCDSHKGFSIVNKADIDVFLKFPCFLHDPRNFGNLISCSSAFSKSTLYIWMFSAHVLLKPCLKDFEQNLARCEMSAVYGSLNILWHCQCNAKKTNAIIQELFTEHILYSRHLDIVFSDTPKFPTS